MFSSPGDPSYGATSEGPYDDLEINHKKQESLPLAGTSLSIPMATAVRTDSMLPRQ